MPNVTHAEIILNGHCAVGGAARKNIANVFHFKTPPFVYAGTGAQEADIMNFAVNGFLAKLWTGKLAAALNQAYVPDLWSCRFMDDVGWPVITGGPPGAVTGPMTDPMPTDTCVSMLMQAFGRGKTNRGAKRFGPLSEADTTFNDLSGMGLVAWQAVQATMIQTLLDTAGHVWTPVIVSRKLSTLDVNPTAIVSAAIVTCLLNKTVGTMRRRREKTVR